MDIIKTYDYITLILFEINLAYENRRRIKYTTLYQLYSLIISEIPNDDIEEEVPFSVVINHLIDKYPNLFEIQSNTLKLNDTAKYEDLIIDILDIENGFDKIQDLYDAIYSEEVFKVLNIKTINNILTKYLDIERMIEKCYLDNLPSLTKYLFIREIFLANLGNIKEERIDAYRFISFTLRKNLVYDDLPIKEIEMDNMDEIVRQLKSLYQYAIFGHNSLAEAKLPNLIENVLLDNSLDDVEETVINEDEAEYIIYFDDDVEDTLEEEDEEEDLANISKKSYSLGLSSMIEDIFFTAYLYELNNYLKNNASFVLMLAKNRLLYALDDGKIELYKEENIIREYEADKMIQLEESDLR